MSKLFNDHSFSNTWSYFLFKADQRHRFLRGRRDTSQQVDDLTDFEGSYDLQFELSQLSAIVGDTKCKVLTNDTVVCDEEVSMPEKISQPSSSKDC